MSIERITNTDQLKGYTGGYQLNGRLYNLQLDGSLDAPNALPKYTVSKSIATSFGIAAGTNYIIPAAQYEDFVGSYDSGDLILNTNGSWVLSAGVYEILLGLNLATTNSTNEYTFELINYDSGVIYAQAAGLASTANFSQGINFMLNIASPVFVAVRVSVSNVSSEAITIQGSNRSSFFSIKRLF